MNSPEQHPDTVLLDKLRAGLLDDTTEKSELEAHLAACADCRRQYDWPALLQPESTAVDQQLDHLRRRALQTPVNRRSRRLLPLAAAAALALVAVALINLVPGPETGQPQLAEISNEVPAIYEDLDFYLWLADHKDSPDSST